jgi:L-amino acid N-acyltransferase YncA
MLVSRQLTNRILGDARRLTKKSLEIRHDCRNTMCISRVLRELLQRERKLRPWPALGTLFDSKNPPKGTA